MGAARKLLAASRSRAIEGQISLVWVALTCTPWCSWQNYNVPNVDLDTFNHVDDARAHSVQKDEELCGLVDFAFEWPRCSSGWSLDAIADRRRVLRYTGEFDGC
eukprot:11335304-Heterocapsa_arctica.AAC.1